MNEICIPLNSATACTRADVEVRLPESGSILHYRLECLRLQQQEREASVPDTVDQLQRFISTYSKDWELLQILDTPKGSGYIQLLYRENG